MAPPHAAPGHPAPQRLCLQGQLRLRKSMPGRRGSFHITKQIRTGLLSLTSPSCSTNDRAARKAPCPPQPGRGEEGMGLNAGKRTILWNKATAAAGTSLGANGVTPEASHCQPPGHPPPAPPTQPAQGLQFSASGRRSKPGQISLLSPECVWRRRAMTHLVRGGPSQPLPSRGCSRSARLLLLQGAAHHPPPAPLRTSAAGLSSRPDLQRRLLHGAGWSHSAEGRARPRVSRDSALPALRAPHARGQAWHSVERPPAAWAGARSSELGTSAL